MKTADTKLFLISTVFVLMTGLIVFWLIKPGKPRQISFAEIKLEGAPRVRSSFSPHNRREAIGRLDYELRRLSDPITGHIPENMRARE
jgi:hypothetical protein